MHFIVVDTGDSRGSVGVCDESNLIAVEAHGTDEDYSSWLLPAVQRVLVNSSLSLSQLGGYAVCAGPGSFTGLRVGLTTVKAWAEIYEKPIVAVSRLEALTMFEPAGRERFLAAYMDARRDQVFAALYRRAKEHVELVGEESVIGLTAFMARVSVETSGHPVGWVTADPKLLETQPAWQSMASMGHVVEIAQPPFAELLGRLAYRKFLQGFTTDALSLDAIYVRRSDAEAFWTENKSALRV
jgi:tRNA threonylcarbamoyladenosine biosynthesis protein TsaB